MLQQDGQTIPADGKVLADYEDKDGSAARRILQGIEDSRRRAAMSEKDEEQDDEGGVDRGPPIVSADQSGITGKYPFLLMRALSLILLFR